MDCASCAISAIMCAQLSLGWEIGLCVLVRKWFPAGICAPDVSPFVRVGAARARDNLVVAMAEQSRFDDPTIDG